VVIDEPCPAAFSYCPGVQANQACQTQAVCDNAATIAALANADQVIGDTTNPVVKLYIPEISMLEYGKDFAAGAKPFAPCTAAASLATAASLAAAGNVNATQYPCALSVLDDTDGDLTAYVGVTQTIRFGESFFDINQQGTGIVLPGEYTYTYSVADNAGNKVGRCRSKPMFASTEYDVLRLGFTARRPCVILCDLTTCYCIESALGSTLESQM
jgi:hypothetical protein